MVLESLKFQQHVSCPNQKATLKFQSESYYHKEGRSQVGTMAYAGEYVELVDYAEQYNLQVAREVRKAGIQSVQFSKVE